MKRWILLFISAFCLIGAAGCGHLEGLLGNRPGEGDVRGVFGCLE